MKHRISSTKLQMNLGIKSWGYWSFIHLRDFCPHTHSRAPGSESWFSLTSILNSGLTDAEFSGAEQLLCIITAAPRSRVELLVPARGGQNMNVWSGFIFKDSVGRRSHWVDSNSELLLNPFSNPRAKGLFLFELQFMSNIWKQQMHL